MMMMITIIINHIIIYLSNITRYLRDWATASRREGSPACPSNRRDWPFLTHPIQTLRTERRPVSSHDTLSQHSGVRWISGRRTTWHASRRDEWRFVPIWLSLLVCVRCCCPSSVGILSLSPPPFSTSRIPVLLPIPLTACSCTSIPLPPPQIRSGLWLPYIIRKRAPSLAVRLPTGSNQCLIGHP